MNCPPGVPSRNGWITAWTFMPGVWYPGGTFQFKLRSGWRQHRNSQWKRPEMGWRTFRNALQKVHLWAGLIFMVPIILIGISGSIIVLLQSIPDLGLPAATARGEQQSIASVIAAAEAAAQGAGMAAAVVVSGRASLCKCSSDLRRDRVVRTQI
jgi:PepSY-associated TM region